MSNGEVVLWGEPLGAAAFLPKLAHSASVISEKWLSHAFFLSTTDLNVLKNEWIANLTPDLHYLCSAQRSFFEQWLKKPAEERFGVDRWGFKEVRLTLEHAKYLKMLFPRAKLVYIYGHPCNAYKLWRGNRWGDAWPGYCIYSAFAFANHWKRLLSGFIAGYKETDGILIKFEELISRKYDISRLTEHLELRKIDESVLQERSEPQLLIKSLGNISPFLISG